MTRSVVVLPSPLLPRSVYGGLAEALGRLGLDVSVADARLRVGDGAAEVIDRWAATVARGAVLVAHSNAGLLAPCVRAAWSTESPIVFMDGALPPLEGTYALAPPRFREHLGTLADTSGMLPPWTRWWPREDVEGVLPPAEFDDVDRACPRLPLAYFDGRLRAPQGWAARPNAYLAFGDTYAEEVALARRLEWPLTRIEGGHLEFLGSPGQVAEAAAELMSVLAAPGRH